MNPLAALTPIHVSLRIASAVILLFTPFAFVSHRGEWVAMLQLSWAAAVLAASLVGTRVPTGILPGYWAFAALLMPGFYTPILLMTGGTASLGYAWLVAMPLAVLAIFREQRPAVATGSLASMAAAFLMMSDDPRGTAFAVLPMTQVAGAAILAFACSTAFASARKRELSASLAKEAAQQKLMESELQRERAERLAMLGSLAVAVAHEVNNPLASAKTNALFLQRAKPDEVSTTEQDEVLSEILVSLGRIEAAVGELKRVAPGVHPDTERSVEQTPEGGWRVKAHFPQLR